MCLDYNLVQALNLIELRNNIANAQADMLGLLHESKNELPLPYDSDIDQF